MPVAPIIGKFRKRLILDLSVAIGLGTAAGYGYWYGVHLPNARVRDLYYLKYEQNKGSEQ
ncbi:hypothetical protein NliqN6_4857 [Naganishia liquefaciens]|uniref:Cytochrome c oxidase subunit 9, mitochondrial n=1 Tax=Naganishia liquefaciens TaxID=104408 RepID=A0A8H3TX60_9TREE|nr:hypothetical protein NliqN6_4857 [Naganishia liquefaciens]